MNAIDIFNSAVSDAIDTSSEFYQALIGKVEFTPEITIVEPDDIKCGALCNELEFARLVSDYYVQSLSLSTAEGDELQEFINTFIDMPRRGNAESDATYRDRFRFVVTEKTNERRTTRWAILDSLSYFVDPSRVQVIEIFNVSNLYFQVRLEGVESYIDAVFIGNEGQAYIGQDFIGGIGIGEAVSYVDELVQRIKAAGVDFDTYFVDQNDFTKTADASIGSAIILFTKGSDAAVVAVFSFAKYSDATITVPTYGFFGGGNVSGVNSNVIDYIDLTLTTGNATDRGDLTVGRSYIGGNVSGSQYGFYGGGNASSASTIIDYIDILIVSGNAIDRGDLTQARTWLAGVSGSQYGFYGGGYRGSPPSDSNVIDYIDVTITSGNAIDRGDLTVARTGPAGVSGSQYGFYGGGWSAIIENTIDYIDVTITSGNAIDRGDLTVARRYTSGVSGSQYGFYGGGADLSTAFNVIDYIDMTILTGNATDRGDLTVMRYGPAGVSGSQYGFFGGGFDDFPLDIIDYIDMTILTGNATDRGDLTIARMSLAGAS